MGVFEDIWRYLYSDIFGENEFYFTFGTTILVSVVFYNTLGGFLLYADLTGRPQWVVRYKVQPGVNQPVSKRKLLRTLRRVGLNQALVTVPYLLLLYPLQKYVGCSCHPEELPSPARFLRDIVISMAIEEVGFYYTHRLAHWGPLYRNIHKTHHEWTAPVGFAAGYSHPLEHLVGNLMPFTLSGVLLGSHLVTRLVWTSVALMITLTDHSGYHLPFLLSPEFHDFHHLKFNYNYGVFGILDWFHGTDKLFRKSKQFQRHRFLLGFTHMTSQYPADDKTTTRKSD